MNTSIKCYAVHLPSRPERRLSILSEFKEKDNLKLEIVPAVKHPIGTVSLWLSIKEIIRKVINEDLFILCEDDHVFTSNYNIELLRNCVEEGKYFKADLISGGVSWFKTGVQISSNLFWIEKFSGLQFTIFYNCFFERILNADFDIHDHADYKISALSNKKFVFSPFMSIQRDFGYSDITPQNNIERRVERLFSEAQEKLHFLQDVKSFYDKLKNGNAR